MIPVRRRRRPQSSSSRQSNFKRISLLWMMIRWCKLSAMSRASRTWLEPSTPKPTTLKKMTMTSIYLRRSLGHQGLRWLVYQECWVPQTSPWLSLTGLLHNSSIHWATISLWIHWWQPDPLAGIPIGHQALSTNLRPPWTNQSPPWHSKAQRAFINTVCPTTSHLKAWTIA